MVQIIENWSDLTGVVQTVTPAKTSGFVAVSLRVEVAAPVEGFAHLLDKAAGTEIEVLVPEKLAADKAVTAGAKLSGRVRRADLKRNYIHRDHLKVEPPAEKSS